ncbi:MAG: lptC [Gammaproteobacteria bacterium]|nr:lptC [Gammaproteobacteria bacterium]
MIYRIFVGLAFIVVIAGTIFLGGQQSENTAPTTVEEPLRDPGYAARNARLVQTGPDGHPLYTLDADVIRQQPNKDTVELEQAKLGFHDTSGNEWHASGLHGEVGQNSGKVELSGDVHVAGILPGTQQPGQIETDRLSFDTHTQIVSTPAPVTLRWSGQQVKAIGLHATLKDGRMQLESLVHGTALTSPNPGPRS